MTSVKQDPSKTTPDVSIGSPEQSPAPAGALANIVPLSIRRTSGPSVTPRPDRMGNCTMRLISVQPENRRLTVTFQCTNRNCGRQTEMVWTDPISVFGFLAELSLAAERAFSVTPF